MDERQDFQDRLDDAILGIVEVAHNNTLTVGLVRARATDSLGFEVSKRQARQALRRLMDSGAVTKRQAYDRFIYLDTTTP